VVRAAVRRGRPRRGGRRGDAPLTVTNALVAANLGLFAWMVLGDLGAFGSSEVTRRTMDLVISREFLVAGEWWRLVTCGFVHFGILHLGMNMLLAWQLGGILEPQLGAWRYGALYGTSLLGGSAGALLLSPDAITGGASGAVFGLMAAAVVGMRERGVNPWRTGLGLTFAINLVFTLAIPGVSVGGHLGGALAGALVGAVMLGPRRVPGGDAVAPLVVSAAAVAVAMAVVGA
jgi:membrane associated rhomboid family serine protease